MKNANAAPSSREKSQLSLQRYLPHLPARSERGACDDPASLEGRAFVPEHS